MKTFIFCLLSFVAVSVQAEDELRTLDERTQALKGEVQALGRELFQLEEELLHPSSTQVSVFLSMDVGTLFRLDSVSLKIDGKPVTHYLYTRRELDALRRGGVQRLYTGNLKQGEHELVAVMVGKGPHDRDYRRAASLKFSKSVGPRYLELRIVDSESRLQPEFSLREWE